MAEKKGGGFLDIFFAIGLIGALILSYFFRKKNTPKDMLDPWDNGTIR